MKFLWSAVLALAICNSAWAQADEELERLKRAAAAEKQEELKDLPNRISKLEKAQEALTTSLKDGLEFKTSDGNFSAHVGGRIYFTYRNVQDRHDTVTRPNAFDLDTARIMVEGTFYKDFFYRAEFEWAKNFFPGTAFGATNTFSPKDLYLGWKNDTWDVKLGQTKEPFSQEENCSSRFIDFAERSLLNRIVPQHDNGILITGAFMEKMLTVELGFYNGSGRNTADVNDEKEMAVRLRAFPFKKSDMAQLKNLRLGVAFTSSNNDNLPAAAVPAITTGDIGNLTFIAFPAAAAFVLEGPATRMGIEIAYVTGPASVKIEYATFKRGVIAVATQNDDSFTTKAYYVSATYLFTGEDKVLDGRLKPTNNFNPATGQWGAFELALRMASIDASDGEDITGFLASTANQKATETTVGFNWFMTPNVMARLNYEMFKFDEDLTAAGDTFDSLKAVYLRIQIDF